MDNLPQELLDQILVSLPIQDLKNCLLVSRKCRHAAEQYAFSSVTLSPENAENAIALYSGHRACYLREVKFQPILSSPDDSISLDSAGSHLYRESASTLRILDQEYTRQIAFLFSFLRTLEINRSENGTSNNLHLTIFLPVLVIDRTALPLQRCFVSWRIHLLNPTSLPLLDSIQTLSIATPPLRSLTTAGDDQGLYLSVRKLDYRVLLDLASRLPNLTTLRCRMGADDLFANSLSSWYPVIYDELRYVCHDWVGPQRETRAAFSKALEGAELRSLRHLNLDFLFPLGNIYVSDQRLQMPDLVGAHMCDPLSSSLGLLSDSLRTMCLRGIFDLTLFWPSDGDTLVWPNLEHLHVMFYMVTPSGLWYFDGPRDFLAEVDIETHVDTIEIDLYPPLEDNLRDREETMDRDLRRARYFFNYRIEPNEAVLTPFLTAFSKAAGRMPKLKTFELWSPLVWDLPEYIEYSWDISWVAEGTRDELCDADMAWGVAYASPGARMFPTDSSIPVSATRQLWWRTAGWRPQEDLHRLFHCIGNAGGDEEIMDQYDPGKLLPAQGRKDFEAAAQHLSSLQ
ncbi:hypothetical protein C7974DRAFT_439786 [Boeremia exigua]|uniref:uncharacterized protein n=1 Tax=Boeremia exigua TaxID=749465 RepID=UPI001E8D7485|nr:uncharacterized protein C7974DRAFT_439786 [Boeremia exigua]KAH6644452.1 hypothetical protein C7974DRAFT_439786 [Boeremia exigua]